MQGSPLAATLVLIPLAAAAPAAELKPETVQAFERYIRAAEARIEEQLRAGKSFLWTEEATARQRQVGAGGIAIENFNADETRVPGGLIHDWTGVRCSRPAPLSRRRWRWSRTTTITRASTSPK